MKKLFYAIMLAMILVPVFVQNALTLREAQATTSGDTPANMGGDGFIVGDYCGYVMGVADPYSDGKDTGTVNFDGISDANQGCVDDTQYFYSSTTTGRESYARYTNTGHTGYYTMDFDYSAASNVFLQLDASGDYWTWTGAARIISSSSEPLSDIPLSQRWIDFEWDCTDSCTIDGVTVDPADYYVRTDTTTGDVSGYAWNDYFNTFISFNSSSVAGTLAQELPPRYIETVVTLLANETTDTPTMVDYTDAPMADGAEYWRVKVQFFDLNTSLPLDADDITSLSITPVATSDSNVFLNQVEDSGDAIETTYNNSYMDFLYAGVDCTNAYETDFTKGCVLEESDGSASFNTFVYSGSPTSNVLGLNDDTDTAIEYYSDRAGCRWIYESQWAEVDVFATQKKCPYPSGSIYNKEDVYFQRETDRNKYEIDYVTVTVNFAWDSTDMEMYTYPDTWTSDDGSNAFVSSGLLGNTWNYYFEDGTSDLSYRPRYQITRFVAIYDGEEHTTISEDTTKPMSLKTQAIVSDTSAAYQSVSGTPKPSYSVYYQMDADSDAVSSADSDAYLLIDTNSPPNTPASGDVEETYRSDENITNAPASYTPSPSYRDYIRNYAIAYGQKDSYTSTCGTPGFSPCADSTNTLTNPTAEQWVCDDATEQTMGAASCYYTEYLPHVDPHRDPESMFVIGAINSIIDADQVLEEISDTEGTVLSTLGTTETINLRNKMYAQVLRYTLGQTGASSGSFELDASGACVPSSGLVELMGGRLIFAKGDVTVDCFAGIDITAVSIGGDFIVNTNITNGRMGLLAFKKDGVGGNVYLNPSVTDLWVNMFLDGSLFSYNGSVPTTTVYPTWGSDEVRLEALLNQLYLKGSVVSHNTVNGADGTAPYDLGDGTTTDTDGIAREYDLNLLRQYRLCWPVVDGLPDESGTPEECSDGQLLSSYLDADGYPVYNSFILEYNPADGLPIFSVESGLFN